jgi:Flp pilus assembly protein TadB
LWALIAVVVNQYGASTLTTGAALVAAVPVAAALVRTFFSGWSRRRERRTPSLPTPLLEIVRELQR